jgi:hypothetical protein
MKTLSVLLSFILAATANAHSLRLIVVSQETLVPVDGSPMKFDLYLYNDGSTAEIVPSLEMFRATYAVRSCLRGDTNVERNDLRTFSHPIKDHSLKAQQVDHTVIEIDISPEGGDYVELSIEIGDKRILRSNSLILLCQKKEKE